MSHYDFLRERAAAIHILRRIDAGEATAIDEVRPFLHQVDARSKDQEDAAAQRLSARERRARTGRKQSGKFDVEPRMLDGTDHGNTGIILARNEKLRLVWRGGSKYFAGIGRQAYAPAGMEVLGYGGRTSVSITESQFKERRGGWRLSKPLIMEFASGVDKHFGAGAAAAIVQAGLKGTLDLSELPASPGADTNE